VTTACGPESRIAAGPFVAIPEYLAQISDMRATNMMHRNRYLAEELGESTGMPRGAIALCCAIMEDAEVAREFEIEPRGAAELLRSVMFTPTYASHELSPLPGDLTSLIA
jgi:hypothetical protein